MKVVILTHGGAELVIEMTANRKGIEIAGILIEKASAPKRTLAEKIKRSIKYDGYIGTAQKFGAKFLGRKTSGAGEEAKIGGLREETARKAGEYGIEVFEVDNYHSDESKALLSGLNPDLGIIYGTNIIKEEVFSIPKLGSINLHQGMAPEYRGGPPVFWELFNGEKEVGLTVHWVAAKVDTGDIILQKAKVLEYDRKFGKDYESFIEEYKKALRPDCAEMIAEATSLIAEGREPRIKQDISRGKRYRLPLKAEKDEMKRRINELLSAKN